MPQHDTFVRKFFHAWRWLNYLYNYSDNALALTGVYVVIYAWSRAVEAKPKAISGNAIPAINHFITQNRIAVVGRNIRRNRKLDHCACCGGYKVQNTTGTHGL
jgi:hypothetical protein